MRRWFWILPFVMLLPTSVKAAVDDAAIRKALQLTSISAQFTFLCNYNEVNDFTMQWKADNRPERAAEEKKVASGTAVPLDYYRLASLCASQNDSAASQRYIGLAMEGFRKEIAADPGSDRATAALGELLSGKYRYQEAETMLRSALKQHPDNWRSWCALGDALDASLYTVLLGVKPGETPAWLQAVGQQYSSDQLGAWQQFLEYLHAHPAPADRIARAQAALDEADACFARAEMVAPGVPGPRLMRCGFLAFTRPYVQFSLNAARHSSTNPPAGAALAAALGSLSARSLRAARPTWEQAARLAPDDYRMQGLAAAYEYLMLATASAHATRLADLPAADRVAVEGYLRRLDRIGHTPGSPTAGESLTALAIITLMAVQDNHQAAVTAREALNHPLPEMPAQAALMIGASEWTDRTEAQEVLDFCNRQRPRHDVPLLHDLLAVHYRKTGDIARAEAEDRRALEMDPDDFNANVSLAADLMEQHDDTGTLVEAGKLLTHVSQDPLLQSDPNSWASYSVTLAAGYALSDHIDQSRQLLDAVIRNSKDDKTLEEARALLAALGT